MDRVERELSKMESMSPTSPQRSHVKNGTVVPGAGSTANLGARSERSGSAKRTPTKFAPGGIELIPQPSSMPVDPLVRSMGRNSRAPSANDECRTGQGRRKNGPLPR
jgi:hypothetical protein